MHRDLKPGERHADEGRGEAHGLRPRSRHGVARPWPAPLTESPTVSRPLTAEGTIVGTFQYMAPEQLEGKEADARTDLWALGCVLYEMATGKRAFEGTSQASLIAAILKEAPRPISELQPLTPPALERIVKRCLEKDPDERFQSARDLAFDLEGMTGAGAAAAATAGGETPLEKAARREDDRGHRTRCRPPCRRLLPRGSSRRSAGPSLRHSGV